MFYYYTFLKNNERFNKPKRLYPISYEFNILWWKKWSIIYKLTKNKYHVDLQKNNIVVNSIPIYSDSISLDIKIKRLSYFVCCLLRIFFINNVYKVIVCTLCLRAQVVQHIQFNFWVLVDPLFNLPYLMIEMPEGCSNKTRIQDESCT